MSPYTVTIENKDRPLERNIFIKKEDDTSVMSWYGEDYIEIWHGAYDDMLQLTKESFLELYELMTVLKKYIDKKEEAE